MVRELLRWGKAQLTANEVSPIDAELLLAHVLGVSRMELHSKVFELTPEEIERVTEEFHDNIKERLSGEPTQYIIGEAPFRYLTLDVGPGVLIPRPETEVLVDEVLHQLARYEEPVSIIDLGSGSGAIAISIVSEVSGKKDVRVVAVEKSADALKWLHQNIAKFDLPIRVVAEDVAQALPGIKADVVVSNPPYIPDGEVLSKEVVDFEPAEALRGGAGNGMEVPKEFIRASLRLLKSGGLLAMEHHESQAELIAAELVSECEEIKIHYDLAQRPRFTTAIKK